MSYHIADIKDEQEKSLKLSKVEEYKDAKKQKCELMAKLELSKTYMVALEGDCWVSRLTMKDLKSMSDITKQDHSEGS